METNQPPDELWLCAEEGQIPSSGQASPWGLLQVPSLQHQLTLKPGERVLPRPRTEVVFSLLGMENTPVSFRKEALQRLCSGEAWGIESILHDGHVLNRLSEKRPTVC